jgi:hypothetical protein
MGRGAGRDACNTRAAHVKARGKRRDRQGGAVSPVDDVSGARGATLSEGRTRVPSEGYACPAIVGVLPKGSLDPPGPPLSAPREKRRRK